MPGPRDYTAGTRAALNTLAQGRCYFRGCSTPVVVFVDGDPYVNADIAHIRDARPGNRYDPTMTDARRAHFDNLILLCRPHHQLVDRVRPDDFPASVLEEWKLEREREGDEGLHGLEIYSHLELALLPLPISAPVFPLPDGAELTPYQALWPRYAVVPFEDHAGVLSQLDQWCEHSDDIAAMVIDGSGGNGKTRAATELCRTKQSAGWLTGFFRHGTMNPIEALKAQRVDRLVVFDYANDKPNQIQAFLEGYLESAPPVVGKTRFLLLTRNDQRTQSISRLRAHQTQTTRLLDSAETISLDSTTNSFDDTARRRLYAESKQAFDALWPGDDQDQPARPAAQVDLSSDTYDTPLFVVLAALLSSYAQEPIVVATRDGLLARILARESELFWRTCPEDDPVMSEELVCVPTIAVIESEAEAQSRLQALGYESDSMHARKVRNWLHHLYPGPHWANGLEPDLLGEYLLNRRLPSGLATHIALHGSIKEASSMLRVLGRIVAEWPQSDVHGSLAAVVSTLPDLLPAWLASERDGNFIASDAIDAAGELIGQLPAGIALPHVEIPGRLGPAGQQLAVVATRRWWDHATGTERWLEGVQLVGRLLNAGGLDEAIELIDFLREQPDISSETVEGYLQLLSLESRALRMSRQDPAPPLERAIEVLDGLPDDARDPLCGLEGSIRQHYADTLIEATHVSDAFGPLDEAVARRRLAVSTLGPAHTPALAASLRARALNHFRERDVSHAATDITEAIEMLKGFVVGQTSVFERDLARCYDIAARVLGEQDSEAATSFARNSLAARTRLAEVFGDDAKLDLLANMVREIATRKSDSLMPRTVDLMAELVAGSLEQAQTERLQSLHTRLQRVAADAEWKSRLTDIGAQLHQQLHIEAAARALLRRAVTLARDGDSGTAWSVYRSVVELGDTTAGKRLARLPMLLNSLAKGGTPDGLNDVDRLVAEECALLASRHDALGMKPRAVLLSLGFLVGWLDQAGGFDGAVQHGRDQWEAWAKEMVRSGIARANLIPNIRRSNEKKGRLARRIAQAPPDPVLSSAPRAASVTGRPVQQTKGRRGPLADDARLLALRDELSREISEESPR